MDEIFSKLAISAVTLVGKAAFGAASGIAIKQVTQIIKDLNPEQHKKLEKIKTEFEMKVAIITPSIELLEIYNSTGNKSIETILYLTNDLKSEISKFTFKIQNTEGKKIDTLYDDLKKLINKIDVLIPYIQLSIMSSGIKIGSNLPKSISPSRFLQASNLLTSTTESKDEYVSIGSPILFTLYKLFDSSVRPKGVSDFTWTEKFYKCFGTIRKKVGEIYYEIQFEKDKNDGRYHSDEEDEFETPIKIPILNVKKLFYSSSGKILNIDELSLPTLILKVVESQPDSKISNGTNSLSGLDKVSWYAFSLFKESETSDIESDSEQEDNSEKKSNSEPNLLSNALSVSKSFFQSSIQSNSNENNKNISYPASILSLFEYLIRLASLEVSYQTSHLKASDEKLYAFLNNSS